MAPQERQLAAGRCVLAVLYAFFACYSVTGKCDLRVDSKAHEVPVFASMEDCQRFGSDSSKQQPDKQGRWTLDESHYYQCIGLAPVAMAGAAAADSSRPVYKTTAEALQRDYQANPQALAQKIGNSVIEVTGTVDNVGIAEGTALQLSGDSWDVTAWLSQEGMAAARGTSKHARVTLRCDRIGSLVGAAGRRPAVVEVRDCKPVDPST